MTARRDVGTGTLFQHKYRDKDGKSVLGKTWIIQYYRDGRRIREHTGQTSRRKAQDILTERLGQVAKGEWIAPRKPVRVEELYRALETHNKVHAPQKVRGMAWRWKHLSPAFALVYAINVTTTAIDKYAEQRQKEGAANATINRELATLRRMFNFGRRTNKRLEVPPFTMLAENNTRTGFVEDADFDRLAAKANEPWLRTFLELAYTYGWRRGELVGLRVRHLNFETRTIRLDPGTTKNGEGREVAMTGRVFELLRAAAEGKRKEDKVLTREVNGKQIPVLDIRNAWQNLCESAGLSRLVCKNCEQAAQPLPAGEKRLRGQHGAVYRCPQCRTTKRRAFRYEGLIPHDMRRSAAKALRRAGVPESVIMDTGGWLTRAMFKRYTINSSADQRAAVEMLERARAEKAVSPNTALIEPESPQRDGASAKAKVQ